MDEIEEFIKRRFATDCNWTSGNCYYFAVILKERFKHLEIVYLTILGHFMAQDPWTGFLYDFNGKHDSKDIEDGIWALSTIENIDPPFYARIIRDCVK